MKKQIAEAVLERDQRRCQYPTSKRAGRVRKCGRPDVELHHRKIRKQLGKDTTENLIALCKSCHAKVHAEPIKSRKIGLLIGSGDRESRHPWMDDPIPEDGYD